MDDNKKKFVNNIAKHIKTFTTSEEKRPDEKEVLQTQEQPESEEIPAVSTEVIDKIDVAPVNAEDQYIAEPDGQLKINIKAAASKVSLKSKLSVSMSDRSFLGGIIIYTLFFINLIGMAIFTRRAGLGLTQSLLYKVHIDSIAFKTFTFADISVLVSYIFSFIFGGLVIFVLLRIGFLITETCGFVYSHKMTRWILFLFMCVFAVISLIYLFMGKDLLSVSVYNWANALFAYGGALAMYCLSLRQVQID